MSDFDKEAERQKLREKYADDEDERAATQRMSQLLLQGATMTNRHCDECGDPRFRYEGREFCPSCEGAQGGTPVQETGDEPAQDAQTTGTQSAGATEPGPSGGNQDQSTAGQVSAGEPEASSSTTRQPASGASAPGHSPQQTPGHAHQEAPNQGSPPGEGPIDGDLVEARRTLARSVRSLAERGATADDPRRAREHLEAAREAADALAALNR
jgi:uncharacterized Zn finger protein (UPF0148 family)